MFSLKKKLNEARRNSESVVELHRAVQRKKDLKESRRSHSFKEEMTAKPPYPRHENQHPNSSELHHGISNKQYRAYSDGDLKQQKYRNYKDGRNACSNYQNDPNRKSEYPSMSNSSENIHNNHLPEERQIKNLEIDDEKCDYYEFGGRSNCKTSNSSVQSSGTSSLTIIPENCNEKLETTSLNSCHFSETLSNYSCDYIFKVIY